MIDVCKAIEIIKSSVKTIGNEKINILSSMGRYTSKEVKAKVNNPPFSMSAMDGYAIKFSSKASNKTKYSVKEEVFAGSRHDINMKEFETIRIFTGGKLPKKADTIIIQENAKVLKGGLVSFKGNIKKNQYVRKEGRDFKKGEILLNKNHFISERDLGLLVSSGNKFINVKKKPKVIIFSTGDEIIEHGNKLKEGQIFASSLYMLKELILKEGCVCKEIKIIKDNLYDLNKNFTNIKGADLVITTGGISVGKKDLVKQSLLNAGLKIKFWKVKIKPGKPLMFGLLKNIPVFSLPGNPVSSYICFVVFVLIAINRLNNSSSNVKQMEATLKNNIDEYSTRESYLRAIYNIEKNNIYVTVLKDQDSSLMKNLSLSNCIVIIKAKERIIRKGEKVKILIYQ